MKESDAKKAINIAYSWLNGWGLKVELDKGKINTLLVEGVKVTVDSNRQPSSKNTLILESAKLLSRDPEDAILECWAVTTAVGAGCPSGHRTVIQKLRASSSDYEATSMRLTPFGRTANPTNAELKKWAPIVKREADCAARRYYGICQTMQEDKDDLWSIGMTYLCTFLHRHRDLGSETHTGACLTLFLRQEYARWANVTCERLKNIAFSGSGVPIEEITSSPVEGAVLYNTQKKKAHASYTCEPGERDVLENSSVDFKKIPEAAIESWRRKIERLSNAEAKGRQQSAAADLNDRLLALTHDKLHDKLLEVIDSEHCNYEAQKEAKRQFIKHTLGCPSCADEWRAREEKNKKKRAPRKQYQKSAS